ncbi:mycofactocin-coupled SDR family oxidoreductase [Nocardia speluncae]|uniref:Mycofactocin-coupled SDR family oxidoreductase n=1 Tax=Nocardia speluncae TaxID=419477 RepID=A0A846XB23_9NOCA|nr:mycofactocin-coupled SDR family oxidoreductase [Nocardia speluncae]NKY33491.1 mycofactocin-coupled SDR family oxidoreductase [Nocardia speluncae]
MTGRVEGKVAFITGAARGQGRSHAVRLAEEGADIIAIDICKPIDTAEIPPATPADLAETEELVKATGRRIVTAEVDVRDADGLRESLAEGVGKLGRLDIIVANAGIASGGDTLAETDENVWQETIDINLSGVWKSVKAGVPHILEGGRGGSIVLTSSVGGLKAYPQTGHYVSAKHGVVGLMRAFAVELGQHMIRVNSVHPTHVSTAMIMNEKTFQMFRPDLENPTADDMAPICQMFHTLPVPWVDPIDISNAVLYLASEEARYLTGVTLPVDCGSMLK